MTAIVFQDTETLGLHIDSPIWEYAAIRREEDGTESQLHLFIHHYADPWLTGPAALPEQFQADYRDRFNYDDSAVGQSVAARKIADFLVGRPTIVGAVPNFDTERIGHQLLRPAHIPEPWHYHLIDIENLAIGYLTGRASRGDIDAGLALQDPPWKSDQLSDAIGVDPTAFDRHTAMGDVLWVRAQWDAVMRPW